MQDRSRPRSKPISACGARRAPRATDAHLSTPWMTPSTSWTPRAGLDAARAASLASRRPAPEVRKGGEEDEAGSLALDAVRAVGARHRRLEPRVADGRLGARGRLRDEERQSRERDASI